MKYAVAADGVPTLKFRSISTAVAYARELLLTGAAVSITPVEKETE